MAINTYAGSTTVNAGTLFLNASGALASGNNVVINSTTTATTATATAVLTAGKVTSVTITNGGIFGSMLSTPILNAPQSAILGLHAINDRPVALNGQVVIRPMMYLALSYDHRLVDGKEAVTYLVKVKQAIEDPARLLLAV